MIRVKPKYHRFFIPTLIILVSCLVIALLVLAAFTRDTAFWVAIVLLDSVIIAISYRSIRNYRKPRIISSPLGKVLEYEGRVELEGDEMIHPIDKKSEKEVEETVEKS